MIFQEFDVITVVINAAKFYYVKKYHIKRNHQ